MSRTYHKLLLFGLLSGSLPYNLFEVTKYTEYKEPVRMSWKQRKKQARLNAQRRKTVRGRSSGTTNKDHVQSKLMDDGMLKWFSLLSRLDMRH